MASPRVFLAASALLVGAVGISSSFGQTNNYNGYFPGWYSPSTAGESLARGRADVIRSQGQFLLDSSAAAQQFEAARSMNIENRYKTTQAYFDLRRMNREGREAERGPRPTHDQLVRWAQAGRPKPLTSSELNPNNGELLWPRALTISAFEDNRYVLDGLMADRAKYGTLSFDQVIKLQQTVDTMLATLKDRIKDFPPNMYIEAKNFLESLAFQAKQ